MANDLETRVAALEAEMAEARELLTMMVRNRKGEGDVMVALTAEVLLVARAVGLLGAINVIAAGRPLGRQVLATAADDLVAELPDDVRTSARRAIENITGYWKG